MTTGTIPQRHIGRASRSRRRHASFADAIYNPDVPRVIIIAPDNDPHAIAVKDRIGDAASILDTTKFPATLSMSLGAQPDDILIGGERVRPTAVRARLWLEPDRVGRGDRRRGLAAQHGRAARNPPTGRERITKAPRSRGTDRR
jgi:hypothetical protein